MHTGPFVGLQGTLTAEEWERINDAAQATRLQQIAAREADVGMYYSAEAYMALLERYALLKGACNHCWHAPHDWQQGTSQLPVPRLCCWCGVSEGPQHGPYAPGGA